MARNITIEVDSRFIECSKNESVLNACLNTGIYIPNLCNHPAIKSIGACRLCLVEIEGEKRPVSSCTTKVKEGMKIKTNTERVQSLRRLAMELILSEHPEDCSSCPKYGNCILQSVFQYIGAGNGRFRSAEKMISPKKNNPLYIHDQYRCIKCGRCVRVCRDVRGVGILKYYRDSDGDIMVGYGNDSLIDADCRFCGACAEICPTGAIRDKEDCVDKTKPRKDALVPCRDTCPAHINIPEYIRFIKNGDLESASNVIREKVPFPLTLGYICTHRCEDACRRGKVNEPISICRLKLATASGFTSWQNLIPKRESSGKKVAIIGSGPAGLTAAFKLLQYGLSADVYEKLPEAGGMLRYGIPEFRLPLDVLRKEISDLEDYGVKINTNSNIKSPQELLDKGYDAVLVAIGTHKSSVLPIEGNDLKNVLKNIDFLRSYRMGDKVKVGAIILTGGIAPDKVLVEKLTDYISWIAPIVVQAGEFEMEGLANGAIRAMEGLEEVKQYTGIPVWEGFKR